MTTLENVVSKNSLGRRALCSTSEWRCNAKTQILTIITKYTRNLHITTTYSHNRLASHSDKTNAHHITNKREMDRCPLKSFRFLKGRVVRSDQIRLQTQTASDNFYRSVHRIIAAYGSVEWCSRHQISAKANGFDTHRLHCQTRPWETYVSVFSS